MFSLIVVNGPQQGRQIPISAEPLTIGREPGCQLRPTSRQVSRRHCQLREDDHRLWLQDLGSSNGTFVNDVRVTAEHLLYPGDCLRVGRLKFVVSGKLTALVEELSADILLSPADGPPTPPPGWAGDETVAVTTTPGEGRARVILAQYRAGT